MPSSLLEAKTAFLEQGVIFRENSRMIDVWNLLSSMKIFMENKRSSLVVKTNTKPNAEP